MHVLLQEVAAIITCAGGIIQASDQPEKLTEALMAERSNVCVLGKKLLAQNRQKKRWQ